MVIKRRMRMRHASPEPHSPCALRRFPPKCIDFLLEQLSTLYAIVGRGYAMPL